MKGFLIILVLCFVSFGSSGQTVAYDSTNSLYTVRDLGRLPNRPLLYVIDGKQIIDSTNKVLEKINPADILEYLGLKDSIATIFYGSKGANGAIVVKTKNYQKSDTINKTGLFDSDISKNALYVIDGVPSKNKLDGINPNDILSIDILRKGKSLDESSIAPFTDAVIVVTRTGATTTYQKKFSSFSKKYKEYIDVHNGDDSGLIYLIDGVQVSGNREEKTRILYNLKDALIKSIVFTHDMGADSSSVPVAIITTK